MSGMRVSLSSLSEFLGVHRHTVTAWVRKGCPYIQKADKPNGQDWIFDTAEVVQWKSDQALKSAMGELANLDENELKLKKLAAETALVEIKAAQASGEVATLEEFEQYWLPEVLELKSNLRSLPSRIPSLSITQKADLLDEIKLTLEKFAKSNIQSL